RFRIVSRVGGYQYDRGDGYNEDGWRVQSWPYDSRYGMRDYYPPQSGYSGYYYNPRVYPRSPEFPDEDSYYRRAPRRIDPDYFFGRRPF
ncbi:MAG: hypothetical protein AB7V13_23680, partial [Pseudorhodoplanes sp.]